MALDEEARDPRAVAAGSTSDDGTTSRNFPAESIRATDDPMAAAAGPRAASAAITT
jgi:hypothetical protein